MVNVSQVFTVDKTQCDEYIGRLSTLRLRQVPDGLRLLTEPQDAD